MCYHYTILHCSRLLYDECKILAIVFEKMFYFAASLLFAIRNYVRKAYKIFCGKRFAAYVFVYSRFG